MTSVNPANWDEGLTLRQAALIAGVSYLLMPVTLAEFYINPKLLIAGNIEQTAQNIACRSSKPTRSQRSDSTDLIVVAEQSLGKR